MNKALRKIPFFAILGFLALPGCNNGSNKTYTVTWKNYNGALLEKDFDVKNGEMPSYDSKKPVHFDDKENYYVFAGWEPELTAVKKDATYTAKFEAHPLTQVEESPDNYVEVLPTDTEAVNILHAFNWTFNDIKHNLPYIADAGFKMVQTLPLQTPKSSGSSWWAFYQPLSFKVADESPLGTKEELASLCEEADKYNISIIADVVFNHMANINDDQVEEDGTPKVSPIVADYEPEIYALRNDADNPTFHHNKNASGTGAETQYYPYGGLPDLNTAHPLVQARALSFLKECIDLGIDGFRFDAAKHIETPDDPKYKSDFWPNTLGVAKEYYHSKTNKDLFAYGEILGGAGARDIHNYTKYMKVTETSYGNDFFTAASKKEADRAINSKTGLDLGFEDMVTWLESHDTYVEAEKPWSDNFMLKPWAMLASRVNTTNLYLARPDGAASVGLIANYAFKEETVGAVNRFHNRFRGGVETLSSDVSVFINEVALGNSKGAVVVSLSEADKEVVDFKTLGTDVYYDQLTGKEVVVRNGHATIEMDQSGICVLTKSKNEPRPSFEISERGGAFFKEKEITITPKNAVECSYQINNEEPVKFTGEKTIKLTEEQAIDKKLTLKVTVKNNQRTVEEEFYFKTVELIEGYFNVVNIRQDYLDNNEIYLWSWGGTYGNGLWNKDYTVSGTTLLVDTKTSNVEGFIVAVFAKGYVPPVLTEWDFNVIKQTTNIADSILAQGYFDASNF